MAARIVASLLVLSFLQEGLGFTATGPLPSGWDVRSSPKLSRRAHAAPAQAGSFRRIVAPPALAAHVRGETSRGQLALRMSSAPPTTKGSGEASSDSVSGVCLGAWLPVASIAAMEDLNPHRVKIMNRNYVVWQDTKTKEWSVQVDACSHRLAPLSQGRIDPESGCIECPYHGYRFDTSGACTRIPQLDPNAKKPKMPVETFPTHVTGDLLWAFFPSSLHGEAYPISLLPEQQYPALTKDSAKAAAFPYFVRELPYSWDMLVDNFMDPSHIPFAHHSLQGVRSDGSPIPMDVLVSNHSHCEVRYQDKIRGKPRNGIVSIQRPAYYHFRVSNNTKDYREVLKIFLVPVAHGRCRVFFKSISKGPVWIGHAASNLFLNTDVWLHDAERVMRGQEGKYILPTSSDLAVKTFREWWQKNGLANAPPHTFGPAPISDLPEQTRAEQVDVWKSHTASCSSCRRAANRFRLVQQASVLVATLSVILLAKISTLAAVAAAAVGAGVYMACAKLVAWVEGEMLPSAIADRSYAAQKE